MKVTRKKSKVVSKKYSKQSTSSATQTRIEQRVMNLYAEFLSFVAANAQQMEQITVTLRQLCQQCAELKEPFSQQSVLSLHAPLATLKDAIDSLHKDIQQYASMNIKREANLAVKRALSSK